MWHKITLGISTIWLPVETTILHLGSTIRLIKKVGKAAATLLSPFPLCYFFLSVREGKCSMFTKVSVAVAGLGPGLFWCDLEQKSCLRKVKFIEKGMGHVLRQEWVMMWLSWELVSQSDEWRIPWENCEAGWAQSAPAWDPLQDSVVLELEALWTLRCCVVLKWPPSPLRWWSSPRTARGLCWYIITVWSVLVRGNAMMKIV